MAYSRESRSLDGTWQAIPDQYEAFASPWDVIDDENDETDTEWATQIYDPAASEENELSDFDIHDGRDVTVPGCFGEERPEFRHFEGWVWYARTFDHKPADTDDRTFLRFGAANYETTVWLNGKRLGDHEGGFTPFSFDVTDALEEGANTLVVRVDNERSSDGFPNDTTDWYNFGGISRSVELVSVPDPYIRNFKVETAVDDEITVTVTVWIDGEDPGTAPTVSFPELDRTAELSHQTARTYSTELAFEPDELSLWHPSAPTLYRIKLATTQDMLQDRVGFREVVVKDSEILVNGESIWLRGISLHEEADGSGRTLDKEDVAKRFEWLNQLGCNFARLAHYPHTEAMARTADEEGILLWEEVPAYWDIDFGDDEVQELYRQQLRELIQRDWNRASVILWSIANETDHNDDVRNEVLPEMAAYVRELDDSRLVTAACFLEDTESGLIVDDPLEAHLDVVGINEYFGWYWGEASMMESLQDEGGESPIVISETGAGAKWGNHGEASECWTEEFQAEFYRDQLRAIEGTDRIVGLAPWILFDFRSPRRQNPFQRGYNRKGLLDPHGRKKLAFDVLSDAYDSMKE